MKPEISVTLVARNAAATIEQAISSVLRQSFVNFELIVVDDGSNDDTSQIVASIKDNRILLIQNNHDYIGSLNLALQEAQGKYIARMDADDYMHFERLRVQRGFMYAHPEVNICGTWMKTFGIVREERRMPSGLVQCPALRLLEGNFMFHPTIMFQKDFLIENSLSYKQGYDYAEDYKLWADAALCGAIFYIFPKYLHFYRKSDVQSSVAYADLQHNSAFRIYCELLQTHADRISNSNVATILKNLIALYDTGNILPADLARLFQMLATYLPR